jgi:glycosyltransferase involved in cell wall biosynthesis
MKVLVVRTGPLFALDDTRHYAERLCSALAAAGHTAELTTIPFSPAIADIVPETTAYRLFDLRHGADLCIGLGPFSHSLKHDNKCAWVFSQYSPFYEHWNTPYGAVTASHTNVATREYVHAMDRSFLSEARLVCAASPTLAEALFEQHAIRPKLLPPPLLDTFEPSELVRGDHFLAAGPLADAKRLPLLVAAFSRSVADARLAILGYEVTKEEREYVQQLIAESPRAADIALEIDPPYQRFRALLSSALGFLAAPFRASAADMFTLAAGSAGKVIVTTNDSGELARMIEDGVDGFVVEPAPAILAQVIDQIHGSRKLAEQMGNRLSARLQSMLPTWETVALELTR